MNLLVRIITIALAISSLNAQEIGWETDYRKALKAAKSEKLPSFLYFTADWCHYCKIMEKTTLKNPEVLKETQPYKRIRIDFDREPFAVSKYGLRGVPAIVLLDGEGNVVATSSGMIKAEPLLAWMRRHAGKISPELAKQARIKKSKVVKEINTALAEKDFETWNSGIEQLFEACIDQNDDVLSISKATLATAVKTRPKESLSFLSDPRLLVRILVGNAFQNQLGEAFSYDPWSSKEHWEVTQKLWADQVE